MLASLKIPSWNSRSHTIEKNLSHCMLPATTNISPCILTIHDGEQMGEQTHTPIPNFMHRIYHSVQFCTFLGLNMIGLNMASYLCDCDPCDAIILNCCTSLVPSTINRALASEWPGHARVPAPNAITRFLVTWLLGSNWFLSSRNLCGLNFQGFS